MQAGEPGALGWAGENDGLSEQPVGHEDFVCESKRGFISWSSDSLSTTC
ncbi:hypothetical protein COMA2_100158 [Candidatus Nitrospira nitrificans]|uniref:Uncharacterized protein n=1 Tax=Candidatus Nitrospira nitrificans TaxID=1742973 RepID=A0A0S4L6X4_9BACT|nr:hypothetical protein COMA2_100158 [Candidatus Nitrospira nitrificans]